MGRVRDATALWERARAVPYHTVPPQPEAREAWTCACARAHAAVGELGAAEEMLASFLAAEDSSVVQARGPIRSCGVLLE